MRLLLDTHALIWFANGDPRLSAKLHSVIADRSNQCFVSIASLWEIAVKVSLNKLQLAGSFDQLTHFMTTNDLQLLPVSFEHLLTLLQLKFHHRDPFDRLLIAQAKTESLVLASQDGIFPQYGVALLWN